METIKHGKIIVILLILYIGISIIVVTMDNSQRKKDSSTSSNTSTKTKTEKTEEIDDTKHAQECATALCESCTSLDGTKTCSNCINSEGSSIGTCTFDEFAR